MDDLELAGLLCSKLCHDLVSPVGAIANGLELLVEEQDPEMRAEALGLLNHSVAEASARLRFFRLAFGLPGGKGGDFPLDEARLVSEAYLARSGVDLDWRLDAERMDKQAIRLLLNMILLAGETLLRGGRVEVSAPSGGGEIPRIMAVRASGPEARFKAETAAILRSGGGAGEPTATDIQPRLALGLAGAIGAALAIASERPGEIVLEARLDAS